MNNYKIIFLSESGFTGKISISHPNARTEIAWQYYLDADHDNIINFNNISGYDVVIIIFPKGGVSLNSEGIKLNTLSNRFSELYKIPIVDVLKSKNKVVAFMQEGPSWYVNDFSIEDQFNFYNQIASCDLIFTHNLHDIKWYTGLFPNIPVYNMPSLLIDYYIKHITPTYKNKTIIGGNFCRWYGGFQSYMVALEFQNDIFVPSMHNKRELEDQIPNLTHLPYLSWKDWMYELSTFRYAVHLMPTIAAGTFSLNCAYFGIPCIGNMLVDTQATCHPQLSIHPEDIDGARKLAIKLKSDNNFYLSCSEEAKQKYLEHYSPEKYISYITNIIKQHINILSR
jgi:hypothetical protein